MGFGMSASAADAIGIGARAIERPSAITSHPTVAFTTNIPESNFRYTQPFKVPGNSSEKSAAVVQYRRYADEILENLTTPEH
jgi:hypothetical protein